MFITSVLDFVGKISLMYFACNHLKLKMLVTGLMLSRIKCVEAASTAIMCTCQTMHVYLVFGIMLRIIRKTKVWYYMAIKLTTTTGNLQKVEQKGMLVKRILA